MNKKIKVIMAGAEMSPFAKVGGLGDVMGSLPIALNKKGVDVKVFLPLYGSISTRKFGIKLYKKNIDTKLRNRKYSFDIYKGKLPGSNVSVFFIKNKVFDIKQVYVGSRVKKSSSHKPIDTERFIFFSKAVIESIKKLNMKADVVHVHDWHSAMTPTFVDEYSIKYDNFQNIKSLLTIHNLANQGKADLDILDYVGLDKEATPSLMEDYHDKDDDKINFMKIGILSADYINTVSPNYAKEILTKEYGEDLEEYLNRRKKHLFGIVNGIDTNLFDPSRDKNIKQKYSVKNYQTAKQTNKKYLQKTCKLPQEDVPVFGLVSRLVGQKGLDILVPALEDKFKRENFQVVVLGTGQKEIEKFLVDLAKRYPEKISANITFSLPLAQKIYAGSDFFLMPSRFEPCGLGQMIAMRYGSIPVVRATGGLKDTVINNQTGIVFKKHTQKDMKSALDKSLKLYKNKGKLHKMIKADFAQDFSWNKSADEYIKLYKNLK